MGRGEEWKGCHEETGENIFVPEKQRRQIEGKRCSEVMGRAKARPNMIIKEEFYESMLNLIMSWVKLQFYTMLAELNWGNGSTIEEKKDLEV